MDDVGEENSRSFLWLIAGTARAMNGWARDRLPKIGVESRRLPTRGPEL